MSEITEDDIMKTILDAIFAALDEKLHLIGSVVEGEARELAQERGIYDKGDFYRNIGYTVEKGDNRMSLRVGSNVAHEPYVLGGKVPSWTPLEPLKSWVERKALNWTDKKTGQPLSVEQMAYMIRGKIKREGVSARNIFAEILKNKQSWIFDQLNSIEVALT